MLTHPNQVLFPNGTLTCLDAMSSYISANPTVVSEFRAAMDESVAYSATHQAVVKQTLVERPEPALGGRGQADPGHQLQHHVQHRHRSRRSRTT